MVRPKTIYSMKAEALENHFLTLQLQTEAGTYLFYIIQYTVYVFFLKKKPQSP
jgi:hypothetical protein